MEVKLESDQEQCCLGIGDNITNDQKSLAKNEEFCEADQELQSSSEGKRKEFTFSSLRNLVRGRSKTRTKEEEKRDESGLTEDLESGSVKEECQGDTKQRTFSKLLHNVSSSFRGRSSVSSIDIVRSSTDQGESGNSGFRIFRRSSSKTELEEGSSVETNKGGTLGRLFGRGKMPSKTELSPEQKGGTLGRLFRRRSISRDSSLADSSTAPELKTASLGRRLIDVFGRKELSKTQEAPQ